MTLKGDPSWLLIPSTLSRKSRNALAWVVLLCDEAGVTRRRDLSTAFEVRDQRHLTSIVAELEAAGCVRRQDGGRSIKVVWSKVYGRAWRSCLNCPRPVKNVRGARYCATCQAAVARHDRAWKAEAFEIWAAGLNQGHSEAAIVYRLHVVLKRPMFTPRRADSVDDRHEGIVPWLLEKKMVTEKVWRDRVRAHAADEIDN